jgi:hypothetical protein
MNVHQTIDLGNGHLIEFGDATWDSNQTSVRDRYPTSTGGFSPRSSSETPIRDIARLAVETLGQNLMTTEEATRLIQAAQDFLGRQPR